MISSLELDDPPTVAQAPPFASPHQGLLNAIVNDPIAHPERTSATLDRVEEVIGLTLGATLRAEVLAAKCREAAGPDQGPCEPLHICAGMKVAAILTESLSGPEASHVTDMLMESELSTAEVVELHETYKIPVSRLEDDLLPVKGQGALVYDSKGRAYVDLDSNYSATNLGNANGEIARGLYNQANLLISQKEDRIQVARARFLKEVHGVLPEGLNRFYWQNSGGEAVDKALKIAKAYTGQTGVVAFEGGFHGRTHGAVAVTHKEAYRKPFGLHDADWVHFAPWEDLGAVKALLSSGKAKIVILELVQGEEGGVRAAGPAFAKGLRALCDEHGAVLIADEVQTGFGRVSTGPGKWFASQVVGVTPDIMVIGKSFGGGYPVTAVVTHPHISEAMKPGYDGSTFGGNPMAMTAALIALRQMRALNIPALAAARSAQFKAGLEDIDSPMVKAVRVQGMMIAIDLPSAHAVAKVQASMKEHGAHGSLSTDATLRWMPPLVITEAEVERVLAAFRQALLELEDG